MRVRSTRFGFGQIAFLVSLGLFVLLAIFGGGASRLDVLSQPLVWLASVVLLAAAALRNERAAGEGQRWLFGYFLVLMGYAAIQLVPLPPAIWTALPGRAIYADSSAVLGVAQPWRPISLTPDLTWSSILSILPALALLAGYGALPGERRHHSLTLVLVVALLSGMLGLAQISGGSGGALRFYAVTNRDAAVGLFANRNHNALLLVLAIPMLVVWARTVRVDRRHEVAPKWLAMGAGIFLLPLILLTGSRAALLLLLPALVGAWLLSKGNTAPDHKERVHDRFSHIVRWLVPLALTIVIIGAVALARTTALDRLFANSFAEEQRSRMLGTLLEMAFDFLPLGSGFGSFDSVYRAYETIDLLHVNYMNQAHNDLMQLIIEGGAPAILALFILLVWMFKRARIHWKAGTGERITTVRLLGRLGSVMSVIILLASLVDYPLRTPLMLCVFVVALIWLGQNPQISYRR